MKSNHPVNSGQASLSPLAQTPDGLVAQNARVRLLVSPIHPTADGLIEDAECNVLVHTFCDLGFSPEADTGLFRLADRGLLVSPAQGKSSAITLQKDARRVRLMYNPTYAATSGQALTHDLRPDIVVEIQTPHRCVHVFDAKYRRENAGGTWAPLREDIDKMHAYRDAIGQVLPTGFERALQSAIALFPAPFEPAYLTHPFFKSLPHGIGGLPLLPGNAETLRGLRDYVCHRLIGH